MATQLVRAFSSGRIVVCANKAVAAWHPPSETPFEHTRPIELSAAKVQQKRSGIASKKGPNNAELKDLFYTDKNEWFSRTRDDRLRSRISYAEGLRQQEKFTNLAKSSKNCDSPTNFLLALEHNPVYTVGIRSKLYSSDEEKRLLSLGADFHRTSRGGLITFHGPGQLVLYPIFDLRRISPHVHGVRSYVNALEEVIIRCSTDVFGVSNVGRTDNTGVWVNEDRKLAALGVAVSHGISYHGLALNCNIDLSWFDNIVGCGIEGVETTSLSRECRRDVSPDEVLPHMLNSFSNVFQCSFSP